MGKFLGDLSRVWSEIDTGSFHLQDQFDPAVLDGWSEFNRLLDDGRVPVNLLRDGHRILEASSSEILARAADGYTIQLEDAERSSPLFAQVCSEVLREGGERCRCNIYFAPSREHTGFGIHHDVLDAIIVQLHGQKHWRVWDRVLEHPLWVMKDHRQDVSDLDPVLDVVLKPGDVLVLRRGDPHGARCHGTDPSMHLTLGIFRTNAQDVLQWIVRELADEPRFREGWPWAHATSPASPSRAEWMERLLRDAAKSLSDANARALVESFLIHRSSTQDVLGGASFPHSIERIQEGTLASPTPLMMSFISTDSIYARGKRVEIPLGLQEFVAALMRTAEPLEVRDLAQRTSADFDTARRLVLELVQLGLIITR